MNKKTKLIIICTAVVAIVVIACIVIGIIINKPKQANVTTDGAQQVNDIGDKQLDSIEKVDQLSDEELEKLLQ